MREVIYYCCDASHVGPENDDERCFFCGSVVPWSEMPVGIPAITPEDLNPDDVSLYGGMNHLMYEAELFDIPA